MAPLYTWLHEWALACVEWFFFICLILHHPLGTVSHMIVFTHQAHWAAERAGKSFTCTPLGLKARTFCGPKVPEWAMPMSHHHLTHTPHALTHSLFTTSYSQFNASWKLGSASTNSFSSFCWVVHIHFVWWKYSLHYHHLASSCGRYWHCVVTKWNQSWYELVP